MLNLLSKALRFGEQKKFKKLEEIASLVNNWEEEISKLSDEQLKAKTKEFKQRIDNGETTEEILPEAFAVVRETGKRTLGMRHFDVQIIGGIVLYQGKIAEMKTGEGKTLAATLPVYLSALEGKKVHLITVNDYLAKRDSEWMGKIYQFLGLKVGLLQAQMEPQFRRIAYQADVTYGTNSEFGFDYLRDNMAVSIDEMVQAGHDFAIVDEIDSILIDEARTPLIISGEPERAASIYRSFAKIVSRLKEGVDYEVDEKTRTVAATESGVAKVEKALGIDNLYDHVNGQLVNHLNQALRAKALFKKDVDYVIKNGEVIIVDEFTGRLMIGRRYSEGLHQAIEAKEKVAIKEENQTLATITLQNYFRMYKKLAGMTGTAATEADEFRHIYNLETVVIPTNEPMIRKDMADKIYKTEEAKFKAVTNDIVERHKRGQPVLIGTISIEKSERLSKMLKKRGVPHQVLNAKHHEQEAEIIAQAGRKGAVTVATNMAGRGVDIILGGNPPDPKESEEVKKLGGLHVLGTERHESRRIDNQLRGRSGRQGDPGSSQFYLSLEDDLMRLFGSDRVKGVMERLGLPDDYPIEHPFINKSIETAQRQVEGQNFEIRKQVLEYDDVMNQQRKVIYEQRLKVLKGTSLKEETKEIISQVIQSIVGIFTNENEYAENWDWDGLTAYVNQLAPLSFEKKELAAHTSQDALIEYLTEKVSNLYETKRKQIGAVISELEQAIMLQVIDNKWREHLYEMDYLREGIGLRAIGQRDPLIEYKREAYEMFQGLTMSINEDYLRYLLHAELVQEPHLSKQRELQLQPVGTSSSRHSAGRRNRHSQPSKSGKIGRNDPCPCGSGKKYKKCCGQ
jgi:preprotein translocase subunit SecA